METVRKELRRHQRVLVPDGRRIGAETTHPPELAGLVTVIGLGGMFIRTQDSQSHGKVLSLRFVDPFVTFEADCTVRNVAEKGLGVEITRISLENERRLRTLLLQLKPEAASQIR
jgi:hypothetical protein